MKIDFCIQGQGVTVRDLIVSVDWDCPYIPRIGETIGTSILLDHIEPMKFYETLSDREKRDWNKSVEVSVNEGTPREEALKGAVESWLDDMIIDVKHIDWCKRNGEYSLFIMLNPDM